MAFCSQCGSQLPEGARFCAKCGASTEDASATPPPAAGYARPEPLAPTVAPANGGARLILPIVIVLAVLVIGYLLWSQREGTRPIAGNEQQQAAASGAGSDSASDRGQEAGDGAMADRPAQPERVVDAARRDADRLTTPPPLTPTFTTASALDSAFFSDPRGAAQRYDGPVRVSGIIATMVTPGPTPALSLEGRSRFNHMIVNFPRGYRERLAPLAKGMTITVSCGSVQALGGTTILNDCSLDS